MTASDRAARRAAVSEASLGAELPRAFVRRELVLRYQPIVDVRGARLRRVEALVRWAHPRHGVLSPDQFVGAASRRGHLRLLSRYVIRTALEQVAAWRAAGLEIAVAVNVDPTDFRDDRLVAFIAALLSELGVAPSALMLEITERGSFDDEPRTLRNIHAIRRLGVAFAIDDFGTGQASLMRLRRLPVSELKIDRAFTRGITVNRADDLIVHHTIALAQSLGLATVIEGVEHVRQWHHAVARGVDAVQGFLCAQPLDEDQVPAFAAAPSWISRSPRANLAAPPGRRDADGYGSS